MSPTMFAAVMVMLISSNAKKLMLGCLLGGYVTSVALGLVIVFAIPGSGATTTARNTLSPALDVALGLIALAIAFALGSAFGDRFLARRKRRMTAKAEKGPPDWRRALDEGSPRVTFAVGAVFGLPGASYLVALDIIHNRGIATGATVLAVVAFSLIMLAILEVPLLGFALAPDATLRTVERFKAWVVPDARRIATWAALVVGVLLVIRGVIEFLAQ